MGTIEVLHSTLVSSIRELQRHPRFADFAQRGAQRSGSEPTALAAKRRAKSDRDRVGTSRLAPPEMRVAEAGPPPTLKPSAGVSKSVVMGECSRFGKRLAASMVANFSAACFALWGGGVVQAFELERQTRQVERELEALKAWCLATPECDAGARDQYR